MKVGDVYDPAVVRRNFARLWDSGLFEDLKLERDEVPGGVALIATVVERPTVADLEFRGNKKMTTSQLKDKLKEGKAEIKVGSPVSFREVAKAKSVLLEAYKSEGFRSVSMEASIETVAENTRRVVFQIDEGDKLKIESINFTGNTVIGAQTLRNAMKKTATHHWWRVLRLASRPSTRRVTTRTSISSGRPTRTAATRTSSSRTRSWTSSS